MSKDETNHAAADADARTLAELTIDGLLEGAPLTLTVEDLRAAPEAFQVPDVGAHVRGRTGRAVRFRALLHDRELGGNARWVDVASTDGFAASLPIEEIADDGMILYGAGEDGRDEVQGGPFRLMIPGYRDACASVKHLGRIGFSDQPGDDTRPRSKASEDGHEGSTCSLERDPGDPSGD